MKFPKRILKAFVHWSLCHVAVISGPNTVPLMKHIQLTWSNWGVFMTFVGIDDSSAIQQLSTQYCCLICLFYIVLPLIFVNHFFHTPLLRQIL